MSLFDLLFGSGGTDDWYTANDPGCSTASGLVRRAAFLKSGSWTHVVGWVGVPLRYRHHLEAGTMIGGHGLLNGWKERPC
jgi:hypothetical protein